MSRPHRLILHLICLEERSRQKIWRVRREMPKNVSVAPIKQMRLILKKKKLGFSENQFLENKINEFERKTKGL